jgi:uncharacterized protein (DUF4415 family)
MSKDSRKRKKELAALAAMRDAQIDFSDAAEVRNWSQAVVGKFYRPVKKSLTIRLDADVLAWLKGQGRGYQTRINKLLRAAMEGSPRARRRRV